MYSHDFANTDEQVAEWIKTMDQAGIERTTILRGATGALFDSKEPFGLTNSQSIVKLLIARHLLTR